jgi:hypothetical protein
MTRETKAGLIVACSFLCLVGTVLFAKLRQGDGASVDPAAEALATLPPLPEPTGAGGTEQKQKPAAPQGIIPARFPLDTGPGSPLSSPSTAGNKPPTTTTTTPNPAPPPRVAPPAASPPIRPPVTTPLDDGPPVAFPEKTKPPVFPAAINPAPAPSTNPPAGSGVPESSTVAPPPTFPKTMTADTKTPGSGSPPPFAPATAFPPTGAPPVASGTGKPDAARAPSLAGGTTPPAAAPGLAVKDPPKLEDKPAFVMPPPPPPANVASNNAAPAKATGEFTFPGLSGQPDKPAGNLDSKPAAVAAPSFPPSPSFPSSSTPPSFVPSAAPPPSLTNAQPQGQQPFQPAPVADAGRTVLPPLTPSRIEPSAGVAPSRPPLPPPSADDAPEKSIRLGLPSAPLNQFAQAPAMAPDLSSSAAGIPQVESYDEETYVCRPGDTFRAISQAYYHSEKYERALLLFNRNHPLAGDAVRQEPARLPTGQAVYIPPLRILEKYYGGAGDPATRPVSGGAFTPSSDRTYRVGVNPEMLLDIARRTLGDENRWVEIYRLNPRIDPKDPVPAGSELRMPPDAH